MADKNKSKIGGISKFASFGGGTKTSEGDSVKTSEIKDRKTSETKDAQTSTSDGHKDVETYEHFNGDEPWGEDIKTLKQQDPYTSVDTDAKVIAVADITLLGGPGPDGEVQNKDVLTLSRHSHIVPSPQDTQASITQRQEDLQTSPRPNTATSMSKDAGTHQLQNAQALPPQSVYASTSPFIDEQLSQDGQTSKRTDSQKKKGARSPEKEEGRQTIYFSDPEQRRVLQALKFLERRDISEIVSDALDLYVEHSPFRAVLPAVLAAQEGKFTGE